MNSLSSPSSPSTSPSLAFIGLGVMGSPMAQNLVKAGYPVKAWNRTPDRLLVQQARQAGVEVLASLAETVQDASMVFTCVSDVADIQSVIFGTDGIAAQTRPNTLIVDFSTIGPQAAQEMNLKLQSQGLRFLDAPISGGDIGARNGTLTIMVGGDRADFEEALPVLQSIGKKIVHCGDRGSGQAVKLCNQILCSLHMVALCEAMQLAENFDLDPQLMIEVCNSGAGGSWALANLGTKVARSDFAPGFMIKHILKDLRLVRESLTEESLPGLELAEKLFKQVQEMGGEEQGTQAMIRAYRENV